MTFGEKFKIEREKKGMTQQEVADALGINRRMITRYENGISFPRTKDAYRKIAAFFGVDVNYLLTDDEEFVVEASEQYGSRGMKQAQEKADGILANAQKTATLRSEEIIGQAQAAAAQIKSKASADIALEKKKAINEAKNEISDLAMAIAGKVVARELNAGDQADMIDRFIDELGDNV